MNWFDYIFGSTDKPTLQIKTLRCDNPISIHPFVDQMFFKHDLLIGDTGWLQGDYRKTGVIGLYHAHIHDDSNIVARPYKDGFPNAILLRKTGEGCYLMHAHFKYHPLVSHIIANFNTTSVQSSSVFFKHRSIIINSMGFFIKGESKIIDIFDTEIFLDDITKMAAMAKYHDANFMEFKEIITGETYEMG